MSRLSDLDQIIDRFNHGCLAYKQALNALENRKISEYEANLTRVVRETVNALSLALEYYLLNAHLDPDDETMLENPELYQLIRLMKKYANPSLESKTIDLLHVYRQWRNKAEHRVAIPPLRGTYDAIQVIRQIILTYLPVKENQLEVVNDSIISKPDFSLNLLPPKQRGTTEGLFQVQIANHSNDSLSLQLKANDPEKGCVYIFDPPEIKVPARAEQRVSLNVLPKNELSAPVAKPYPFTITAQLAEAPELAQQISGEWEHIPLTFHLTLLPTRQTGVNEGIFLVQINNQSETELKIELKGDDPNNSCRYTFDAARITLAASQQRKLRLKVESRAYQSKIVAKTHPFTITAWLVDNPRLTWQVYGEWEQVPEPAIITQPVPVEVKSKSGLWGCVTGINKLMSLLGVIALIIFFVYSIGSGPNPLKPVTVTPLITAISPSVVEPEIKISFSSDSEGSNRANSFEIETRVYGIFDYKNMSEDDVLEWIWYFNGKETTRELWHWPTDKTGSGSYPFPIKSKNDDLLAPGKHDLELKYKGTQIAVGTFTIESPPSVIANRGANIRSGPSTDYPVIGWLNPGQSVLIIGRNPDSSWWQISVSGGNGKAWVTANQQYVTAVNTGSVPIVEASLPLATNTPSPVVASVNLRAYTERKDVIMYTGPGRNYGILLNPVPPGIASPVTGRSQDSSWLQVNSRIGIGWVLRDEVKVEGMGNINDLPVIGASPTSSVQFTAIKSPGETNYGLTRFSGNIKDRNGNWISNISIQATCGDYTVHSQPSGTDPTNPDRSPGFYDITIDTKPVPCQWQLRVIDGVSEDVLIEVTTEKSVFKIDWQKNW